MDIDTTTATSLVVTLLARLSTEELLPPSLPAGVTLQEDNTTEGLALTFSGEQPVSEYVSILTELQYRDTRDEAEPEERVITVQVFSPGDTGDPLGSNIARVTVELVPVNDNSPVFDRSSYNGSVLENSLNGTEVGVTVIATDADIYGSTDITYRILGGSADFAIDPVLGVVETLRPLDADSGSRLRQFEVIAEDNDSPVSRSATVSVSIEVLDVNDLVPVFNETLYTATIAENLPVDSTVLQVFATDGDSTAVNSEITYQIQAIESAVGSGDSPLSPTQPPLPFRIDTISGAILLDGSLDFESTTEYNFRVLARDSGSPSLTGMAEVTVTVDDVNDNEPRFIGAPFFVNVSENTNISTPVLTVVATDADSSINGQVEYSLVGDVPFGVELTSGVIFVQEDLDYETNQSFSFIVIARDLGVSSLSAAAEVTIFILNVNDNPPIFVPSSFSFTVVEGSVLQEQITAFDADGDVLTFIESSGFDDIFEIVSSTGELISVGGFQFDFELQEEYSLQVQVTDGMFSAFADVTIQVTDLNDLPPVFSQDIYEADISEDAPVNASVLQVEAIDGDTGTNAEIQYSIAAQSTFAINPSTGEITVASSLDFDAGPREYNLSVTARNTAAPFLSDTAMVIISVTDANDVHPMLMLQPLEVNFVENTGPVLVSSSIVVTDTDSAVHPLNQCRVRLDRGNCSLSEDELTEACGSSVTCRLRCAESIMVDDSLLASGITLSDVEDSNSQTLTITGSAAEATYQQILATLSYDNVAVEPIALPRLIEIQCFDASLPSNTLQITVSIVLTDDFCVNIQSEIFDPDTPIMFEFSEGMDNLAVGEMAALLLTDRDRTPHDVVSRLRITLEDAFDTPLETISITESLGLIVTTPSDPSSGFAEAPEVLTPDMGGESMLSQPSTIEIDITGSASLETYTQALRSLEYVNQASEPILGDRRITISSFRGDERCDSAEITISLVPINDNPPDILLNTTDPLQYFEESGPLAFAAEAGLRIVDLDHNDVFNMEAANVTLLGAADGEMEQLKFNTAVLPASVTASNGSNNGECDRQGSLCQ